MLPVKKRKKLDYGIIISNSSKSLLKSQKWNFNNSHYSRLKRESLKETYKDGWKFFKGLKIEQRLRKIANCQRLSHDLRVLESRGRKCLYILKRECLLY
jgi:hypothetical protein